MSLLKSQLEKLEQQTSVSAESLARVKVRVVTESPQTRGWRFARPAMFALTAMIVIAIVLNTKSPTLPQPNIALAAALENTFGSSITDFYHHGADGETTYRIWEVTTPRPNSQARPMEIWSDGQSSKAHAQVYYFDGATADLNSIAVNDETCTSVMPQNLDTIHSPEFHCYTTDEILQEVLSNITPHFRSSTESDFAIRAEPITVTDKNLEGFLVHWQTMSPIVNDATDRVHYIEGARELGVDTLDDDLLSIEYTNRQSGAVYEHARFYSKSLSNILYGFTFQILQHDAASAMYRYNPIDNTLRETTLDELSTLLLPAVGDSNHLTNLGPLFAPVYYAALNNELPNPVEVAVVELDGRPVTYYRFPFTTELDEFTNMWKKRELLGGNNDQISEFWVDDSSQTIVQYRFTPAPDHIWQLKLVHDEVIKDSEENFFDIETWKAALTKH